MRLFDEQRLLRSGLNLRDLIIISVIVVSGNFIGRLISNALWSRSIWYGLDTPILQIRLLLELGVIPLLGILVGLFVHGSSRLVVQCIVIFFFSSIIADTIARLIAK